MLVSSNIVLYEASSYGWGPPGLSQVIEIFQRPFPISISLRWALGRLRDSNSSHRVWIDAICVNRSDKTKRSAQVLLMHQVYSLASRVVAWLGDHRPSGLANLQELTQTNFGLGIQDSGGRGNLYDRSFVSHTISGPNRQRTPAIKLLHPRDLPVSPAPPFLMHKIQTFCRTFLLSYL